MNHMIHIAAITQLRLHGAGRAYYRRKAAGKKPMEAMRCLKRRISDAIYRQLLADAARTAAGQCGASQESSAVDLPPHIDTSDQPLPGPAPKGGTGHHRPRSPTPGLGSPPNAYAPAPSGWSALTGRTSLTTTSAGAHSKQPNPAP